LGGLFQKVIDNRTLVPDIDSGQSGLALAVCASNSSVFAKRKDFVFSYSSDDTDLPIPEPSDQRLARLLWLWRRDQQSVLEDGRDVQKHIAGLLEWFLCDAFTYYSQGAKQGWWSDGVTDLQLASLSETEIRAIGCTWWGAKNFNEQWIAPFEIDFYFPTVESIDFTRTVVRFGRVDRDGEIMRTASYLHPRLRNGDRNLKNSDWAMAIELTPPPI
jgi:hypothetical protein